MQLYIETHWLGDPLSVWMEDHVEIGLIRFFSRWLNAAAVNGCSSFIS